MKWPLHLIVFPPGEGSKGGGFKSTAMRIYSRWGDDKIKHQKGWVLNLIPTAIFIVVAICALIEL